MNERERTTRAERVEYYCFTIRQQRPHHLEVLFAIVLLLTSRLYSFSSAREINSIFQSDAPSLVRKRQTDTERIVILSFEIVLNVCIDLRTTFFIKSFLV